MHVRCKQESAAHLVQVRQSRDEDGNGGVHFGAAAELVAENETAVGGRAQDDAQLAHFHLERGQPLEQVVVAQDAREDGGVRPKSECRARHVEPRLRHDDGNTDGANEARFADGIGAVNEHAPGTRTPTSAGRACA